MADPSSRRKLTAILSADVVGYSSLMAANEAATVDTLKSYRDIIARLVVRRGGRVVNAPGDALLAEFPSAVEAVQAAIEIQKSLEGHNIDLEPDRRMQFRIGVNLGDVIEEADGTIYGDGVNIAARMEALAEGGGVRTEPWPPRSKRGMRWQIAASFLAALILLLLGAGGAWLYHDRWMPTPQE